MNKLAFLMAFGAVSAFADPLGSDVTLKAAEIARLTMSALPSGECSDFIFEGRVLGSALDAYAIADETGAAIVRSQDAMPGCEPGNRVRLNVSVIQRTDGSSAVILMRQCVLLEKGDEPPPLVLTTRDIHDGRGDWRPVEVSGVISDVYCDEIDPDFVYLTLSSEGVDVAVSCLTSVFGMADATALLDCAVSVRGVCDAHYSSSRKYVGRYICVRDGRSFRILHRSGAPQPILPQRLQVQASPEKFPHRRFATGEILARWDRSLALLRADDGRCIRLHLADGESSEPGARVRALGFVRDDAYFVYLDKVVLDELPPSGKAPPPVRDVVARDLLFDENGRDRIDIKMDGTVVRLTGRVADITSSADSDRRCLLDCDGTRIPVVLAGVAAPELGSQLSVTGVFAVQAGQGVVSRLVRLAGVSVIVRRPADVVVLRPPPFWTPKRVWAVALVFLILLFGLIVRNRVLRRLVERRSRQLAKEEIRHATAVLKVNERTRLALELHDSVAQNLTGLALRLDIVQRTVGVDDEAARSHLGIAAQMLRASHDEVRACIWDLRNLAIDEPNLNEAIRRSVANQLANAVLRVRFNVPRKRLTDNLAHALLRIIRELIGNAVRHGHARTVSVAGAQEGNRIFFSVRDDGVGFDVATAPGAAEGHFGLQGVRERLRRHGGVMRIASSPRGGTRVSVEMDLTMPLEEAE